MEKILPKVKRTPNQKKNKKNNGGSVSMLSHLLDIVVDALYLSIFHFMSVRYFAALYVANSK